VLTGLVRRIAPALELLNVEDAVSLEAAARAIAFPGRKA
jgi:hypothetical protein